MPDDEICARCGDTGLVELRRCTPSCRLRHAPECPVTIKTKCPACEKAELGDDLPSGAA